MSDEPAPLPITEANPPAARPPSAIYNLQAAIRRLWPVSGAVSSIAAVDGLRGVAVLLTVGFHLLWRLQINPNTDAATVNLLNSSMGVWNFGLTGVELFFVLSGFLLSIPYARAMLGLAPFPSTRKFFVRRALRILPAYWASLLLIVIFLEPRFITDPTKQFHLFYHFFLIHDWTWATNNSINSPYWTMAVESHFYLLLPLIGAAMVVLAGRQKVEGRIENERGERAARGPHPPPASSSGRGVEPPPAPPGGRGANTTMRRAGWGLLLIISASFIYDLLARYVGERRVELAWLWEHISIGQVFIYLCVFGVGIGCSWLYVAATETGRVDTQRLGDWCKLATVGGVGLVVGYALAAVAGWVWPREFDWAVNVRSDVGKLFWPLRELVVGLAYGGLLLGTLLGWPALRRAMSAPAIRFVGVISYSLYIWNDPIYAHFITPLAENFGNGAIEVLVSFLLTLVITIPFAFLFYHVVERPFVTARRAAH